MEMTIGFAGGNRSEFGDFEYERIVARSVVARSLRRFRNKLKQVCLYFEDVNGPRGGIDKQCRCVLYLRNLPPVVINDRDESIRALVHRIADRASHTLSRIADRQVKRLRNSRRLSKQRFLLVADATKQNESA